MGSRLAKQAMHCWPSIGSSRENLATLRPSTAILAPISGGTCHAYALIERDNKGFQSSLPAAGERIKQLAEFYNT